MIKTVIQNKCSRVTDTELGSKSLTAELRDRRISRGGFFSLCFTSQKLDLYAAKYGTLRPEKHSI